MSSHRISGPPLSWNPRSANGDRGLSFNLDFIIMLWFKVQRLGCRVQNVECRHPYTYRGIVLDCDGAAQLWKARQLCDLT